MVGISGGVMLVKTFGSAVYGVDAITIHIEIDSGGNPVAGTNYYNMVGLPDSAVREGFQRIEAAITNVKFKMPRSRTIVNLAPANIRKEGSAYDLAIALGILAASKQIPCTELGAYVMMGELSLDGTLRPIKGALPIAIQAKEEGFKGLLVPMMNAREAAMVDGLEVYGLSTLSEAIGFFQGKRQLEPTTIAIRDEFVNQQMSYDVDFADVRGQENIKRAMEIAAAGGHNLILIGPPGAGKTMLARRLPTILPPLNLQEALENTKIHSVAGVLPAGTALVAQRPFRSPHHTISDVALVGGGSHPMPGEISLAHNGVLFLDELPEFKRSVLEVLRQPMEERRVTISRARITVDYPANFMLVASMNPCPCGHYNNPEKACSCNPGVVKRYLSKISGPLLDRIDLHVEVTPVSYDELASRERPTVTSAEVAQRVVQARAIQAHRFRNRPGLFANAQMPSHLVRQVCVIDEAGRALVKKAMEKLQLSARAYDRILKVARTAADLAASPDIKTEHLAEAIHFRNLDREGWAG